LEEQLVFDEKPYQEDVSHEVFDVMDVDVLPSLERDDMMQLERFNVDNILCEEPIERLYNEDDNFLSKIYI
ncbi:unnamed protein product, partial [Ilex paraguariensis]